MALQPNSKIVRKSIDSGFLALLPKILRSVSTSTNSAAQPSDGLSGQAQLETQAESERFTGERAVSSGS